LALVEQQVGGHVVQVGQGQVAGPGGPGVVGSQGGLGAVLLFVEAEEQEAVKQVVGLLLVQLRYQLQGFCRLLVVRFFYQCQQDAGFGLEVVGLVGRRTQVAQATFHAARQPQQLQKPAVAFGQRANKNCISPSVLRAGR
jgi:hypothetical protein